MQCRSISVIYNIVYDKQRSIFYVDDAVYNYSDIFNNISCGGVPDSDKKELLSSDMKPVYVDDDEYWKTGYYYNPNDNHILVKNRMFDGNYSFNLANPKARFICGGLYIVIKAAVVYKLVVLLPFSNVKLNVDISSEKMKEKYKTGMHR